MKEFFSYKESDSLKTKVRRGTGWTLILTAWTRGIGIVTSIIVTRLLSPEDFGLMAIATATIGIMKGVTETGFNSAIIQKQVGSEKLLDSAWTMEIIKGVLLFVLLFFSSSLIAKFYNVNDLVLMLRIIGLTFLLKGMENVGVIWFRKNLDIRKEFILNAIPDIFYFIAVVILAFILRSVWALVFGAVLAVLIKTIVSYFMHPYRPKIDINFSHFSELFSFGKWILGGSIINMLRTHGISLYIAKYFNVIQLGIYNRAQVFSEKIFNELTRTLWKVGFPAFSMLSTDKQKFGQTFLVALRLFTVIGFPLSVGLYALGPELVRFILTEKWIEITPLIRVFALASILRFIQTPVGISYQSYGLPAVNTKISSVNFVLILVLILPVSANYGLIGIVLLSLFSNLVTQPVGWKILLNRLGLSTGDFLTSILPQFGIAAVMGGILLYCNNHVIAISSVAILFMYIFIGALIYISLMLLIDSMFKLNIKNTVILLIK